MKTFISGSRRFALGEAGVTSIEYALVASLIAVVCVGAVVVTGGSLNTLYLRVCNSFPGASC